MSARLEGRRVEHFFQAPQIDEGPGFRIRRAIPNSDLDAVGPFLLLDQIGPRVITPGGLKPLAPHPHAGIETLTYLLEGSTEHHDTAGHSGTIHAGEIQWMRAGRGIVHSEGPGEPLQTDGGPLHAIQLWIDLPKGHKHVKPEYRSFRRNSIPALEVGDAKVHLLAGSLGGRAGPVCTFADPFAIHASFASEGAATLEVPTQVELGLYVMTGCVSVEGYLPMGSASTVILGEGETVTLRALEPSDVLLFGGPPIAAPIVRHGPFVMNSNDEIQAALRDYRLGRMGYLPLASRLRRNPTVS